MENYVLITAEGAHYIYVDKNTFKGVGNVPVSGDTTIFISEEYMSVFSFGNADKPNYSQIYTHLSEYYKSTSFYYNVFKVNNTIIAVVMEEKESVKRLKEKFSPQAIVPYEFNIAYGIFKRYKHAIIYKGVRRYYYISNNGITVSLDKNDLPIEGSEYVVNCPEDFPELDTLTPVYKWKIDKRIHDFPEEFRILEFADKQLNILKENIVVQTNKFVKETVNLTVNIVLAILVGVGIGYAVRTAHLFVVHYNPIGVKIPQSVLQIKSPDLREFVYQKGYPYTLYEIYNNNNVKVGYFTDRNTALGFMKQHPELQLYKTVYGKNGVINKTPVNETNSGGNNGG